MKAHLHYACRRYPTEAEARQAFHRVADRLYERQRDPSAPDPTVMLALGRDPAGPHYLTIYGPDEAEVAIEAADIGGEPVDIPREYQDRLSDHGVAGVEPQPGWLRA